MFNENLPSKYHQSQLFQKYHVNDSFIVNDSTKEAIVCYLELLEKPNRDFKQESRVLNQIQQSFDECSY